MNGYRLRLSFEVVDYLYLAVENDDKVVGAVSLPEEDLPRRDLPYFSVAPQEFDLVVRQSVGKAELRMPYAWLSI